MSDQDLRRFGGWRSQGMATKYTDVSTEKRLKLSEMLL
jgi:hypothetical protein